jgi:hypothetical protein
MTTQISQTNSVIYCVPNFTKFEQMFFTKYTDAENYKQDNIEELSDKDSYRVDIIKLKDGESLSLSKVFPL